MTHSDQGPVRIPEGPYDEVCDPVVEMADVAPEVTDPQKVEGRKDAEARGVESCLLQDEAEPPARLWTQIERQLRREGHIS